MPKRGFFNAICNKVIFFLLVVVVCFNVKKAFPADKPPLLLLPVLPSYSRVRITGGFPSHT